MEAVGIKWEVEKDSMMRVVKFTGSTKTCNMLGERALLDLALKYIENANKYGGIPLAQNFGKDVKPEKGKIILNTAIIFPDASSMDLYYKNEIRK